MAVAAWLALFPGKGRAETAFPSAPRGAARGASFQPLRKGENLLAFGFGSGIPLSSREFKQEAGQGFAVGAEWMHQVSETWALGLQADALPFAGHEFRDGNVNVRSEVLAFSLAAAARYAPLFRSAVGPYFLAGAGFNHFSKREEMTPARGFLWADTGTHEERNSSASSVGTAFLFGAGVQVLIFPGTVAGLEARWHYFETDRTQFGAGAAKAFSALMRMGWRF